MSDGLLFFGQSIQHAGNNRLREPLGSIVRTHGFAERHEDADVRILADELRDAVAGVLARERSWCGKMVRHVVCSRESMREMDVVEALQNPDAALVRFSGNP